MQSYGAGYPSQPHPHEGMPQVIQPTSPGPKGGPQLIQINREAAKGLGITQMIIGIICVILHVILLLRIKLSDFPNYVGYGIWGGALVSILWFAYI